MGKAPGDTEDVPAAKEKTGEGKKREQETACRGRPLRCSVHFGSKLFYFGEQMLGDSGAELSSKRTWGGLRGADISDRTNQHLLFQPGRPQHEPEFT